VIYPILPTVYKKAFNELKKWLVSTLLLAYFYPERPLILEIDTLDSIIAAIYFQKQPDGE